MALTLAASITFTSCIGPFRLTSQLRAWNNNVGDKFLNELVFFAFCFVVPVYEMSFLADFFVLNSIEFWSGNNPLEASKTIIKGNDGIYICECDGKGYTITSKNDGSVVRLDFDDDDKSWSVAVNGGESTKFMTFIDENHVKLPARNGGEMIVELSQEGLIAYKNYATSEPLMAQK